MTDPITRLIASRSHLLQDLPGRRTQDPERRAPDPGRRSGREAEEGGCGVVGLACSIPVAGRHIRQPSCQMHNRGNGKGGGIAAVGLVPDEMGVSRAVLEDSYLIQIAILDPAVREEVERQHMHPFLDIQRAYRVPTLPDYRAVPGLNLQPPDVWRYFARVKEDVLQRFIVENHLQDLEPRRAEDEFVYQNSYRLNKQYYASLGDKRAFVLCHGRNLLVFKIVGYAEEAAQYYQLDDLHAHVWIAHQRYPTKGRVWHPGGAHPFIGLHEALVHNGDFANYHAVCEYLRQRNISPLFLTDTEVSVLLFDLWRRVYNYPLEYVIEALAPTTERDFRVLPPQKQELYRIIQATHMHGSPDGPWFFIIARRDPDSGAYQLMGITDTSMLRPQVFALYGSDGVRRPASGVRERGEGQTAEENEVDAPDRGKVQIGLIASEKQAIDAALASLAAEDPRFCPVADRYWNARGGSHTDGGAFVFSVVEDDGDRRPASGVRRPGEKKLICTDKFGKRIVAPAVVKEPAGPAIPQPAFPEAIREGESSPFQATEAGNKHAREIMAAVCTWDRNTWDTAIREIVKAAIHPPLPDAATSFVTGSTASSGRLLPLERRTPDAVSFAIETLTLLRDRRYDTEMLKRSRLLASIDQALAEIFDQVPPIGMGTLYHRVDAATRDRLCPPPLSAASPPDAGTSFVTGSTASSGRLLPLERRTPDAALVIDTHAFPPEGPDGLSHFLVAAYRGGWRRIVAYNYCGQRFTGCGLGPDSHGLRIDVYGSSGDYLGSGLDGAEIHVHGSGQDQLGQILKRGKLVIHGDVGQTFMYGAKGGEAYVLGNAAGRPLINAVGRPRVVINGTCLDYLAESFMAGDPLDGGGFVIINGLTFDDRGQVVAQETPYPGGNLFSLASGGAIYLRDPYRLLADDQLNGGQFAQLTDDDWKVMFPYLEENQRLFGISIHAHLLMHQGKRLHPAAIYRKVQATKLSVLAKAPAHG